MSNFFIIAFNWKDINSINGMQMMVMMMMMMMMMMMVIIVVGTNYS